MIQAMHRARSVLSHPRVYNALQSLLGGKAGRRVIVSYLDVKEKDRILDMGCGTAEILSSLPLGVDYTGFDPCLKYIDWAKSRHGSRGSFLHQSIQNFLAEEHKNIYDKVIAIGLIHHLSDDEIHQLYLTVCHVLKDGGEFFSIDCCYTKNQSMISRFLIDLDRGENVRHLYQYKEFAMQYFEEVIAHHRNDLLRIPYDHALLVCRKPLPPSEGHPQAVL